VVSLNLAHPVDLTLKKCRPIKVNLLLAISSYVSICTWHFWLYLRLWSQKVTTKSEKETQVFWRRASFPVWGLQMTFDISISLWVQHKSLQVKVHHSIILSLSSQFTSTRHFLHSRHHDIFSLSLQALDLSVPQILSSVSAASCLLLNRPLTADSLLVHLVF